MSKMREYTDTQLLDTLQRMTNKCSYTGRVVLRDSVMCRGWRLHETSGYKDSSSKSVRQAIINYIEETA